MQCCRSPFRGLVGLLFAVAGAALGVLAVSALVAPRTSPHIDIDAFVE